MQRMSISSREVVRTAASLYDCSECWWAPWCWGQEDL